jgi:hypothetical protein
MDFPEQASPNNQPVDEQTLDFEPLKFGRFKGKTPEQVAELPMRDRQYLVWAFENVGNFDVCSSALYRDLGGKGSRAKVESGKRDQRKYKPEQKNITVDQETGELFGDRYSSRASSPAKQTPALFKPGFNDMDDDIPF